MIRPTFDEWLDIVRDERVLMIWEGSNMTNAKRDKINLKTFYNYLKTHSIGGETTALSINDFLTFSERDKATYDGKRNPMTGDKNLNIREAFEEGYAIPLSSSRPDLQAWIDEEGAEKVRLLDVWADVTYKMGFDTREHYEIFSHIMKNPEFTNISIHLDSMLAIERIEYKYVRQEKEESNFDFMILDITSEAGLPLSNSNPPSTIRAKLYDFSNSNFKDVIVATSSRGFINPITQKEDVDLKNFISETAVLAKYPSTNALKSKLDNASIYIIREQQIKELYSKINKGADKESLKLSHRRETLSNFLQTRITNLGRNDVTFVEPNLQPMKNVFKIDQDFRNQIYERFDNKGAKKVLEILQYELRLQGRKTREGRGSGKSDVVPNKSLAFHITGITNYRLHVDNSFDNLFFIVFLEASREGSSFEYYEDQIIFPNESNSANFLNYKIDDWLKISPNVIRRTKQDILAYLDFIQTTYRTKKMIWDEIPANIKTQITNNIKEIIERSLYGNLTMRTRRGAGGMRVTKNVLKSIVDFKQSAEQDMTKLFGGVKRFRDLNKEELTTFIQEFSPRNIIIDDIANDIKFEYIITNNDYNVSGKAGDKITQKEKYLTSRADASMKFAIMAKTGSSTAEMGLLLITFDYGEDDKMDKIEATSFTITREALEWRASDSVITSSKEISLEYPFDEIGVYMREVMTGPDTFTWRLQIYEGAPQQRGFEFAMPRLDPTTNRRLGLDPLWSNMRANPIRGEVVGYAVGRGMNGGYQFLMPDSTLTAAGEAGQMCLGRIYIKYYDVNTERQITVGQMDELIEDENFTLENLKGFIISTYSDYKGACIKLDRDRVRNDTLGALSEPNIQSANYPSPMMMQAITRGSAGDFGPDGRQLGQDLDQEIENPSRVGREGAIIPGASGFTMTIQDYTQQLKLFRKFGKPFFDFIDSKIIEALNNGTLKYGAKSVLVGTTDGEGYYVPISSPDVTIIHRPSPEQEYTIGGEPRYRTEEFIDDGPDDEDDP